MTASVFSKRYEHFRELLIRYRKSRSLTQSELAERLRKPQSFVSKYESGERRLDVVELLDICAALRIDPRAMISELTQQEQ